MSRPKNDVGDAEAGSPPENPQPQILGRREWMVLGFVLGIGLLLRVAYLLAQPNSDPFLEHPFVDGKLYLDWARALNAGTYRSEGAFYHAPLYPAFLSLVLRLGGDSVRAVFVLQALLSVGTAGLLGWIGVRRFGLFAGVTTAALVSFHQPVVFFAATPMGETLALFLLALALALREKSAPLLRVGAGLSLGLSALARPNFLLVGLVLGVWDLARRDWKRALGFAAGAALALVPVAVRNAAASGHFVPISSNGGVTFYHGNAAGARGIYQAIPGTSGDPARQRAEATTLARRQSGRDLDPVEADAWWGSRARQARLDDLPDTLALTAKRALLTVADREIALDYDPLLDANPFRPVLRLGGDDVPGAGFQIFLVPFALLFALALVALVARGWRGTGGLAVWGPLAACFVTPLLFYVSSRYRLPCSVLLALPAGAGLASLVGAGGAKAGHLARGVGLLALLLSIFAPVDELFEVGRRQSLSNRLGVLTEAKRFEEAERTGLAALELGDSYELRYNLGYLFARMGRNDDAREEFARAFALGPQRPEAARELGLSLARAGRFGEAVVPLEAALKNPVPDREAWAALATAYRTLGDDKKASQTVNRARAAGVILQP